MTRSQIFTAAHKLAKKFTGDYSACFALALREIYESQKIKPVNDFDLAEKVAAAVNSICPAASCKAYGTFVLGYYRGCQYYKFNIVTKQYITDNTKTNVLNQAIDSAMSIIF